MGSAAKLNVSNDYNSNSQNTLASSHALSEGLKNIRENINNSGGSQLPPVQNINISNDYNSTSQDTVPSSFALSSGLNEVKELIDNMNSGGSPEVPQKNLIIHEWVWNTAEDQSIYYLGDEDPIFPDPNNGIYFIFLDSLKINKGQYEINLEKNSIILDTAVAPNQILSISYIGY